MGDIKKGIKKISIVVPCYNEEKVIINFHEVCSKIIREIKNYSYEYIFVNDGSSDSTLSILKDLSIKDKSVKYISFSRNYGKESGILAGLRKAKGDYVVLMDADLQHPPKLLKEMVNYIEEGYDSVAARRIGRKGESKVRTYLSMKFYNIVNRISDVQIVSGATDYRMMTRQMVDSVLEINEYNRFTKGIFEWVGYDTKWLEYESEDRIDGESKWSFSALFRYAIEGIVAFSTTPLKISSYIGCVASASSFIYAIYILLKTLIVGKEVPGYASIIFLMMFLGGTQLIVLGIIGEYLSRTYLETKKRPNYFIKEHNIDSDS